MIDSMPVPPSLPADGVVPLSHLGVIRVAGEDAAKFLHGQLTQDIEHLPPGGARNALDCALWELESRESGLPVWKLAGLPAAGRGSRPLLRVRLMPVRRGSVLMRLFAFT